MVKYKLCTHVQIVVELIMFNSDVSNMHHSSVTRNIGHVCHMLSYTVCHIVLVSKSHDK